jgi:hypothetical protein
MSTAQRQTLPWLTRCLLQSLDDEIKGPVTTLGESYSLSFPLAFLYTSYHHIRRGNCCVTKTI